MGKDLDLVDGIIPVRKWAPGRTSDGYELRGMVLETPCRGPFLLYHYINHAFGEPRIGGYGLYEHRRYPCHDRNGYPGCAYRWLQGEDDEGHWNHVCVIPAREGTNADMVASLYLRLMFAPEETIDFLEDQGVMP